MIGPRPDARRHRAAARGLGSASIWAASRRAQPRDPARRPRLFACRLPNSSRRSCPHGRLHARGGPRRAARVLDAAGFRSRSPGGPQRRRIDAAIYAGSVRIIACAASLMRHTSSPRTWASRDRPRQAGVRAGQPARQAVRLHADPDNAFHNWCDPWLLPAFRKWNISDALAHIRVPVSSCKARTTTREADRGGAGRVLLPGRGRTIADTRHARPIARLPAPRWTRSPASPTALARAPRRRHSRRNDGTRISVARKRWPTQSEIEQRQEPDRLPDRSLAIPPLEAAVDGDARLLTMDVDEKGHVVRGLRAQAQLLRLGVDIELADPSSGCASSIRR